MNDFENLPKIKELLTVFESDNIVYNLDLDQYEALLYSTFVPEYIDFINGAWYAYKEIKGD
ncbi:MAG: hypothetical protein RSB94_06345 [Erysipelotrichaceae bacterium]